MKRSKGYILCNLERKHGYNHKIFSRLLQTHITITLAADSAEQKEKFYPDLFNPRTFVQRNLSGSGSCWSFCKTQFGFVSRNVPTEIASPEEVKNAGCLNLFGACLLHSRTWAVIYTFCQICGFKETLETEKTFLDYLLIGTTPQLSNFFLVLDVCFLHQRMIAYCYIALTVYIQCFRQLNLTLIVWRQFCNPLDLIIWMQPI